MGRIRTVKPELFTHEVLYDIELKYKMPIRLTFIGLFTQSDREGRFKWRPRELKLGILPYDEVDFNLIMKILLENKFIDQYKVNGELYGYIPTWHRHQSINNKERESQIPNPSSFQCNTIFQSRIEDISTTPEARVEHASSTHLYLTQGEGKGKEGKGKDICEVSSETPCVPFEKESIVTEIFHHWQLVMSHPKAKLDSKRKKKIEAALKLDYTLEQLKQAIDGCSLTPYNMGTNPQMTKYDDIDLIFRDADHIERFIQNTTPLNVNQIDQIFEGAI